MKSIKEPKGYVLYEGKSLYKESENDIVVILQTGNSANKKTGNMMQVWIMLKDIDPVEANKLGLDNAICGICTLRGIANNDPERKEATVCKVQGNGTLWNFRRNGPSRFGTWRAKL